MKKDIKLINKHGSTVLKFKEATIEKFCERVSKENEAISKKLKESHSCVVNTIKSSQSIKISTWQDKINKHDSDLKQKDLEITALKDRCKELKDKSFLIDKLYFK